jgi:predicted RNA-binding protein with PUA-like domain
MKAIRPMPQPVSLARIKSDPTLADMVLLRQSRLSVQPVTPAHWRYICELGAGV